MAGKSAGGQPNILILQKGANVAKLEGTNTLIFSPTSATDVITENVQLHGYLVGVGVDFPNASGDTFAFRISDNNFGSATVYEQTGKSQATIELWNLCPTAIPVAGNYKVTFSCANDLTATTATCAYKLLLVPGG